MNKPDYTVGHSHLDIVQNLKTLSLWQIDHKKMVPENFNVLQNQIDVLKGIVEELVRLSDLDIPVEKVERDYGNCAACNKKLGNVHSQFRGHRYCDGCAEDLFVGCTIQPDVRVCSKCGYAEKWRV